MNRILKLLSAIFIILPLAAQVPLPSPVQSGGSGGGSVSCSGLPALTGDTTTSSGSCATTTSKINGTAVPASASVLGTNSSNQPVAATQSAVSGLSYAAGGGTANAQTVTLSPAITAYAAGLTVSWLPTAANTTSTPTLNVNGVGAKTIIKVGGGVLAASDLTTTAVATAVYDGTYFELQNPQTAPAVACGSLPALTGDTTSSSGSCATTTSKINGTTVPASAAVLGTNGSNQPIAATQSSVAGVSYAAGGGTANAQTVTLSPAITSYAAGLTVRWLPTAANTTTTPTLNVNGVGAETIIKVGGGALAASDLTTTAVAEVIYDGTKFELQNPQTGGVIACAGLPALTGDTTTSSGSCATTTAKINGTTVPASAAVLGTNSSSQPVAATTSAVAGLAYAAGGGTANAQTVTLSPAIASYAAGLVVNWLPTAANTTTTPTLNVNGVAAKTIIKVGGAALAASDLTTTAVATAIYDGTYFELQNPQTASVYEGPTTQSVVTGSRSFNSVYHNTNTVPLFVTVSFHVSGNSSLQYAYAETDSSSSPSTVVGQTGVNASAGTYYYSLHFEVLAGNYYEVAESGASLDYWTEWH